MWGCTHTCVVKKVFIPFDLWVNAKEKMTKFCLEKKQNKTLFCNDSTTTRKLKVHLHMKLFYI